MAPKSSATSHSSDLLDRLPPGVATAMEQGLAQGSASHPNAGGPASSAPPGLAQFKGEEQPSPAGPSGASSAIRDEPLFNPYAPLLLYAKCGRRFEVDRGGMIYMSSLIRERLQKQPKWFAFYLDNDGASIDAVLKYTRGEQVDPYDLAQAVDMCDVVVSLDMQCIRIPFIAQIKELVPGWCTAAVDSGKDDARVLTAVAVMGVDLKSPNLTRVAMRRMTGPPPIDWPLKQAEEIGLPAFHALNQAWKKCETWEDAAWNIKFG